MSRIPLNTVQHMDPAEAVKRLDEAASKMDDNAKVRASDKKGIYGSTKSVGSFKVKSRAKKRKLLHKELNDIGEKCFGKNKLLKAAWKKTIERANLNTQSDLSGKQFKEIVADMKNALMLAEGLDDGNNEQVSQSQAYKPNLQAADNINVHTVEPQENKAKTVSSHQQVSQLPEMSEEEEDALINRFLGGGDQAAQFQEDIPDYHKNHVIDATYYQGKVPLEDKIDATYVKNDQQQVSRARSDSMEVQFDENEDLDADEIEINKHLGGGQNAGQMQE